MSIHGGRRHTVQVNIDECMQRIGGYVDVESDFDNLVQPLRGAGQVWLNIANGTVWYFDPASTAAALAGAVRKPSDIAADAPGRVLVMNNEQTGTVTLGAGGTVTVNTARLTASSKVFCSVEDPGAGTITGFAMIHVTAVTPGSPGSFVLTAVDDAKAAIATARCVVNWFVKG